MRFDENPFTLMPVHTHTHTHTKKMKTETVLDFALLLVVLACGIVAVKGLKASQQSRVRPEELKVEVNKPFGDTDIDSRTIQYLHMEITEHFLWR